MSSTCTTSPSATPADSRSRLWTRSARPFPHRRTLASMRVDTSCIYTLPLIFSLRGPNVSRETAWDGGTYLSERTLPRAHYGFRAVLMAAPRFPSLMGRPIRFADWRPVHRPRSALHGRLCPLSESRRDGPPRCGRDRPVSPVRASGRGLGRSAAAPVGPHLCRHLAGSDDCDDSASRHCKPTPTAIPVHSLLLHRRVDRFLLFRVPGLPPRSRRTPTTRRRQQQDR